MKTVYFLVVLLEHNLVGSLAPLMVGHLVCHLAGKLDLKLEHHSVEV
jgi:hypothetical protein